MRTTLERFQAWRKAKAANEMNYFQSAMLIGDYIIKASGPEQIKNELVDKDSPKYKALHQYKKRLVGVLLYCKFTLDEILDDEQMVSRGSPVERTLLVELRDLVIKVYNAPFSTRTPTIDSAIAKTNALLALELDAIVDKKHARVLCMALYGLLSITKISLMQYNEFNMVSKKLIDQIVNVDEIKKTIDITRDKVEAKVKQIDEFLLRQASESQAADPSNPAQSIQGYLNLQLSQIIKSAEPENVQINRLEQKMAEISKCINIITNARIERVAITKKIENLSVLSTALKENDLLTSGRQYALELINEHSEPYNLLLSSINSKQRVSLQLIVEQLKSPSTIQGLKSNLLYGMSWLTSLTTVAYRNIAPQGVQDLVAALTPETLDSKCKSTLKEFIEQHLMYLKTQLAILAQDSDEACDTLTSGNAEFRKLLFNETSDNLELVVKANNASQNALHEYIRVSAKVRENSKFITQFRNTHTSLTLFITAHDGFLVSLSNFFSRFSSLFKTETAEMIDRARDLQLKLHHFETKYEKEVMESVSALENIPDLSKDIKQNFKQKFLVDILKSSAGLPTQAPDKKKAKELLQSTSLFFSGTKAPALPLVPEDNSQVILGPVASR